MQADVRDDKDMLASPDTVISKAEFGRRLGITRGRVSHLVKMGMPVRPDGKVDEAAARAWYDAHIDPSRRRGRPVMGATDAPGPNATVRETATSTAPGHRDAVPGAPAPPMEVDTGYSYYRAEHERLKAEKTAAQLAQLRGEMLPKAQVHKVLWARARLEREMLTQFPARVAPLLAAEFGVPERPLLDALEGHVRAHLEALAALPLEGLD